MIEISIVAPESFMDGLAAGYAAGVAWLTVAIWCVKNVWPWNIPPQPLGE